MTGETQFLLLYMDAAVPFSMSHAQRYIRVPVLGYVGGKMGLGL